jgi:uncharacterized protein (TIGR03067 family)
MIMKNRFTGFASVFVVGMLGLGAGLSIAAPADDAAVSPAVKAVQGTWVTSGNEGLDAKWVFKGEAVEVTVNGMEYSGKIKLDDQASPHHTLDLAISEGPEAAKGKTGKGVYKLDGEKLVISVSHPGHDRPKDFQPVPEEVYVFELKKQK